MIGTLGQFVREIRDLLTGSGDPIPVDIGTSIDVSIDNTSIEVSNDVGNPIPISDGGSSITVDGPLTNAELRAVSVPVGDNSGSLTVDSKAYRTAITVTRPSNTTGYIAGDVVGAADAGTPANAGNAIITLSNIGPSGGYVLIQSVRLMIGATSLPAGMGAFRLHLYMSSPTAILDNAAFDLVSGDVGKYAGYIDLPAPQDLGSILVSQADYCGTAIKLDSASTTLFAELETRGAFTPASGTLFDLRVLTLEAGL
jgi:hypothetical protein